MTDSSPTPMTDSSPTPMTDSPPTPMTDSSPKQKAKQISPKKRAIAQQEGTAARSDDPLGDAVSSGRPGPLDINRTLDGHDTSARERLRELVGAFPGEWRGGLALFSSEALVKSATEERLYGIVCEALEFQPSSTELATWERQARDALAVLREVDNGRRALELPYGLQRDRWLFSVGGRLLEAANRAKIRLTTERSLLIEAKADAGRKKGLRAQRGKAREKASPARIRELFEQFEANTKGKIKQKAAAEWIARQLNNAWERAGELDKKGRPKTMAVESVRSRLRELGLPG